MQVLSDFVGDCVRFNLHNALADDIYRCMRRLLDFGGNTDKFRVDLRASDSLWSDKACGDFKPPNYNVPRERPLQRFSIGAVTSRRSLEPVFLWRREE